MLPGGGFVGRIKW